MATPDTGDLWDAAREEHLREQGLSKAPPFNIWLDSNGLIRTYLNTFDTASGRVDKSAAAALHALTARQPIQLVVQRSQRKALEDAVRPDSVWRVDPALGRAVEFAIAEYNRVRAPLYPLPKIQRLGYLDEQDTIKCIKTLGLAPGCVFEAGSEYVIRSTTVAVRRWGEKMNTRGEYDHVQWDGQELAFFITDHDGVERCFMEERLRSKEVKINIIKPGAGARPRFGGRKEKDLGDEQVIDFTLNELAGHFEIPEVPDVATLNHKQYQANLKALEEIVAVVCGDKGRRFNFRKFQFEDYARAAMQDGIILGHDTGLGKTLALLVWALLKCGYLAEAGDGGSQRSLRPAKPVLLVVPGDGHDQTEQEAWDKFRIKAGREGIVRLDSQETFYRLAKPNPINGKLTLEPNYYLTSYTQLASNGVADFPPFDQLSAERTMQFLNLKESDAVQWWENRGTIYQKHYLRLGVSPDSSYNEIKREYDKIVSTCQGSTADAAQESYGILKMLAPIPGKPGAGRRDDTEKPATPAAPACKRFNPLVASIASNDASPGVGARPGFGWEQLADEQQAFVRTELVITRYREFREGIGTIKDIVPKPEQKEGEAEPDRGSAKPHTPWHVKCVYSPSLADLCSDAFDAIVIDEGTKIKGDDTIIGTGVRQINAPNRLILTATPIKNRFPDLFHLAHFVCGGNDEPTARFPYGKLDKQTFAEEFLVSERNLTKEENSESKRRYVRFTPQVCNVHRAWKLLAPVILRRRKEDCGEQIVPKIRHVVRVPMGLSQAATYQYHLKAKYLDVNLKPAIGAKLQALRIAAANPASELLVRPYGDKTEGNPRSNYTYIPKVASALELVRQAMERREQVIVGSAFQNGLDVFSARLREAGVRHLLLDGRVGQKRRGELARQFKQGCPRALDEGLISRASIYPVLLAGQESMAELHSFTYCNNVILTAFSWAYDKLEQIVNRAHRLNSPWPVNVWSVICDGSIDRKLEGGLHEKKDAAELVLDGHLLGETSSEVNLAELLHTAMREFKDVKTMDEEVLQQSWPQLRAALGKAFLQWSEPIKCGVQSAERGVPSSLSSHSNPTQNSKPKTENCGNPLPLWKRHFFRTGGK
jgi:hypothetical protein